MSLPKYKYLLTYRDAEILYDLTIVFTKKYLLSNYSSHLGAKPDYRFADQLIQAARSTKQNIAEAVGQSDTSKKGEIKLLGVARGSVEELTLDYEDFLRQRTLVVYMKNSSKVKHFQQTLYRLSNLSNLSDVGYLKEAPVLPENPTDAANFLLTLSHITSYLLDKQIKAMEAKFISSGGYTENLFKRRINQKSLR